MQVIDLDPTEDDDYAQPPVHEPSPPKDQTLDLRQQIEALGYQIESGQDKYSALQILRALVLQLKPMADLPTFDFGTFKLIVKQVCRGVLSEDNDKIADALNFFNTIKETCGNQIQEYSKLYLLALSEVMIELQIDTEIGKLEVVNKFFRCMTDFTYTLKKQEICTLLFAQFEGFLVNDFSLLHNFKILFEWVQNKILGSTYHLEDIKSLIPITIKCLEKSKGDDELNVKEDCEAFITSLFTNFGADKAKQFIEMCLMTRMPLYSIFYNWYYSADLTSKAVQQRPQTAAVKKEPEIATPKIENSRIEDDFPMSQHHQSPKPIE